MSSVRGACPRLEAPMQTGDGLLARIVPTGPIAMDAFAALCAAARTHGNGLMEVSARGSLQIRGLTQSSAPHFASAVEALGIDHTDQVPVLANPLPLAGPIQDAVAALRAAIAARDFTLAPKVSVIVDDGSALSFDALIADIRLRAVSGNRAVKFHVLLGGDASSAASLGLAAPHDAPQLVCRLLGILEARGPFARARDVLREDGLAPFLKAGRTPRAQAPARPTMRPAETVGLHRLPDDRCAIGMSLPFGQIQALDLIALLRIARANGAAWAATGPHRTLVLGPIDEMTAFALATAADTLGFVVDARDVRRRVVACAGAPACASGLIPARALAADIAAALPQGELAVHVSGCAKGCAHQTPAPLTIVGTERGSVFVRNGTAQDVNNASQPAPDVVAEAVRVTESESADA